MEQNGLIPCCGPVWALAQVMHLFGWRMEVCGAGERWSPSHEGRSHTQRRPLDLYCFPDPGSLFFKSTGPFYLPERNVKGYVREYPKLVFNLLEKNCRYK